jgi:ferritin-like protein
VTADRRDSDPIQISEAELVAMTAAMDEMHHASLPSLRGAADEWKQLHHDARADAGDRVNTRTNRRRFLIGSGVALGGLALAACGSSSKSRATAIAPPTSHRANDGLSGDLAIAAVAAGLENLMVSTYLDAAAIATTGYIGKVPPSVVAFTKTVAQHHQAHAEAWNAILTGAGKRKVTGVDRSVKTEVFDPAYAKVREVGDFATLALELENVAAATYLNAIGVIAGKPVLTTAARIQPVELQHTAILNFVIGKYPVPESFATTEGARQPADVIG